jgi:hypothetical protein
LAKAFQPFQQGIGLGQLPHHARRLVRGHRQRAERAHIYGVVGQALGEFRNKLLE